ncbi:MAG: PilZ domain-containing protein [Elusimicrobiota bacterium]|nr:MAG: PilZ domain-containing protein [Elusimicrobiota bacterium]
MSAEKRESARFITDLPAVLRTVKDAKVIDDHATAHDVSTKGFKVETQVELAEQAQLAFTLDLPGGGKVEGLGRVVWANRETWATWAGVEIVKMTWSDKRRLANLLSPDRVDWARISSSASKLLFVLVVVTATHRVLNSVHARETLAALAPKIVALVVMGWAFLGMIRRERR